MVYRRKKARGYTKAQKKAYARRMSKRRPKRKTFSRRRNASTPYGRQITSSTVFSYAPPPGRLIPPKLRAKLRYATGSIYTSVDVPAASLYIYNLRGNSVYDPDYDGVGHQPRGFDQYAALYSHYEVVASHITMTFDQWGTDGDGLIWGVFPQPESSADIGKMPFYGITAANLYSEMGQARWVDEMPYIKKVFCTTSASNNTSTLKYSATTAKVLNKRAIPKGQTAALVTTNPTAEWLWTFFVGTNSAAIKADAGQWHATIVYDVIFSDPVPLVSS